MVLPILIIQDSVFSCVSKVDIIRTKQNKSAEIFVFSVPLHGAPCVFVRKIRPRTFEYLRTIEVKIFQSLNRMLTARIVD